MGLKYWNESWNPLIGCTHLHKGCDNCWAAKQAWRNAHNPTTQGRYKGLVECVDGRARWTGRSRLVEELLERPYRWRKPRVVAVCWMGDLFAFQNEDTDIERVLKVIKDNREHTWLLLTKRPHLAALFDWTDIGPYVWLGTSVENQMTADLRIPSLLKSGSPNTWVSYEPALGPVSISYAVCECCDSVLQIDDRGSWRLCDGRWQHLCAHCMGTGHYESKKVDLVIAGAESGPGARPADVDWFRAVRDQCKIQNTRFVLKQLGPRLPVELDGKEHADFFWKDEL